MSNLRAARPRAAASVVSGSPRDHVERLVEANMPLVTHLVQRRLGPLGLCADDYQDALIAGSLGLLRAAERFDPSRNIQFSTYAADMIIGYLLKFLRELRRSAYSAVSGPGAQAVPLDTPTSPGASTTLEDDLPSTLPQPGAALLAEAGLDGLLSRLNLRQAMIVRAIYCDGLTQTAVARQLGITRAGVCDQLTRALRRMGLEPPARPGPARRRRRCSNV